MYSEITEISSLILEDISSDKNGEKNEKEIQLFRKVCQRLLCDKYVACGLATDSLPKRQELDNEYNYLKNHFEKIRDFLRTIEFDVTHNEIHKIFMLKISPTSPMYSRIHLTLGKWDTIVLYLLRYLYGDSKSHLTETIKVTMEEINDLYSTLVSRSNKGGASAQEESPKKELIPLQVLRDTLQRLHRCGVIVYPTESRLSKAGPITINQIILDIVPDDETREGYQALMNYISQQGTIPVEPENI